jgi:hypothetical protein
MGRCWMALGCDCLGWLAKGGEVETNQLDRRRRIVGLVFLFAGLTMVAAAVLLLLFADLPPAVAAAIGVPGLGLVSASRLAQR